MNVSVEIRVWFIAISVESFYTFCFLKVNHFGERTAHILYYTVSQREENLLQKVWNN